MNYDQYKINDSCRIPQQVAVMADSLYHSLQGQYFVGFADNVFFENKKNAWAALVNPCDSGVNLFVNVWTVTAPENPSVQIQIWLNSDLPGCPMVSKTVTPSNTALCPLPQPKTLLMHASDVFGTPECGVNAYVRTALPGATLVAEEDGKFIIPPGGNFAIFLSGSECNHAKAEMKVAYGWWEEKICR